MRKPRKRIQTRFCTVCDKVYHRRNLVETWVQRNPGHNSGWLKKIVKICVYCMSAKQAQRILNVAVLVPVGQPVRRRA